VGGNSDAKLAQAHVYGEAQTEKFVLCCAVVVTTKGSASTVGASGVPPVQVTCTWSERTVVPGAAGWVALANDKNALVVLEGGRAITLALAHGALIGNVSACSSKGGCAIACVYEPFVF
jgi:hypothetical protein